LNDSITSTSKRYIDEKHLEKQTMPPLLFCPSQATTKCYCLNPTDYVTAQDSLCGAFEKLIGKQSPPTWKLSHLLKFKFNCHKFEKCGLKSAFEIMHDVLWIEACYLPICDIESSIPDYCDLVIYQAVNSKISINPTNLSSCPCLCHSEKRLCFWYKDMQSMCLGCSHEIIFTKMPIAYVWYHFAKFCIQYKSVCPQPCLLHGFLHRYLRDDKWVNLVELGYEYYTICHLALMLQEEHQKKIDEELLHSFSSVRPLSRLQDKKSKRHRTKKACSSKNQRKKTNYCMELFGQAHTGKENSRYFSAKQKKPQCMIFQYWCQMD